MSETFDLSFNINTDLIKNATSCLGDLNACSASASLSFDKISEAAQKTGQSIFTLAQNSQTLNTALAAVSSTGQQAASMFSSLGASAKSMSDSLSQALGNTSDLRDELEGLATSAAPYAAALAGVGVAVGGLVVGLQALKDVGITPTLDIGNLASQAATALQGLLERSEKLKDMKNDINDLVEQTGRAQEDYSERVADKLISTITRVRNELNISKTEANDLVQSYARASGATADTLALNLSIANQLKEKSGTSIEKWLPILSNLQNNPMAAVTSLTSALPGAVGSDKLEEFFKLLDSGKIKEAGDTIKNELIDKFNVTEKAAENAAKPIHEFENSMDRLGKTLGTIFPVQDNYNKAMDSAYKYGAMVVTTVNDLITGTTKWDTVLNNISKSITSVFGSDIADKVKGYLASFSEFFDSGGGGASGGGSGGMQSVIDRTNFNFQNVVDAIKTFFSSLRDNVGMALSEAFNEKGFVAGFDKFFTTINDKVLESFKNAGFGGFADSLKSWESTIASGIEGFASNVKDAADGFVGTIKDIRAIIADIRVITDAAADVIRSVKGAGSIGGVPSSGVGIMTLFPRLLGYLGSTADSTSLIPQAQASDLSSPGNAALARAYTIALSRQEGLPSNVALAQMNVESSGGLNNTTTFSKDGTPHYGPLQVSPGVLKDMSAVAGRDLDQNSLYDLVYAGVLYLKQGYDKSGGSEIGASVYHNGGPGALQKWMDSNGKYMPAETRNYMGVYQQSLDRTRDMSVDLSSGEKNGAADSQSIIAAHKTRQEIAKLTSDATAQENKRHEEAVALIKAHANAESGLTDAQNKELAAENDLHNAKLALISTTEKQIEQGQRQVSALELVVTAYRRGAQEGQKAEDALTATTALQGEYNRRVAEYIGLGSTEAEARTKATADMAKLTGQYAELTQARRTENAALQEAKQYANSDAEVAYIQATTKAMSKSNQEREREIAAAKEKLQLSQKGVFGSDAQAIVDADADQRNKVADAKAAQEDWKQFDSMFKQTMSSMSSMLSKSFQDILTGQKQSWSDFWKSIENMGIKALSDIAAKKITGAFSSMFEESIGNLFDFGGSGGSSGQGMIQLVGGSTPGSITTTGASSAQAMFSAGQGGNYGLGGSTGGGQQTLVPNSSGGFGVQNVGSLSSLWNTFGGGTGGSIWGTSGSLSGYLFGNAALQGPGITGAPISNGLSQVGLLSDNGMIGGMPVSDAMNLGGGALGIGMGAYSMSQGNYVGGGAQMIGGALTMAGMPEIGVPVAVLGSLFGGLFGGSEHGPSADARIVSGNIGSGLPLAPSSDAWLASSQNYPNYLDMMAGAGHLIKPEAGWNPNHLYADQTGEQHRNGDLTGTLSQTQAFANNFNAMMDQYNLTLSKQWIGLLTSGDNSNPGYGSTDSMLLNLANSGAISGTGAIGSVFTNAPNSKFTQSKDLQSALQFARGIDDTLFSQNNNQYAVNARNLTSSYQSNLTQAAQYGVSTDYIEQAYAVQKNRNLQDQGMAQLKTDSSLDARQAALNGNTVAQVQDTLKVQQAEEMLAAERDHMTDTTKLAAVQQQEYAKAIEQATVKMQSANTAIYSQGMSYLGQTIPAAFAQIAANSNAAILNAQQNGQDVATAQAVQNVTNFRSQIQAILSTATTQAQQLQSYLQQSGALRDTATAMGDARLTPQQAYDTAISRWREDLASAKGGNLDALSKLTSYGQAAVNAESSVSGGTQTTIYNEVTAGLNSMADQIDQQNGINATDAKQQLNQLQTIAIAANKQLTVTQTSADALQGYFNEAVSNENSALSALSGLQNTMQAGFTGLINVTSQSQQSAIQAAAVKATDTIASATAAAASSQSNSSSPKHYTSMTDKMYSTLYAMIGISNVKADMNEWVQSNPGAASGANSQLALFNYLAGIGDLPGYASGTDFAPGGWSMVGERGPEMMYVPRGSTVVPTGGDPNAAIVAELQEMRKLLAAVGLRLADTGAANVDATNRLGVGLQTAALRPQAMAA